MKIFGVTGWKNSGKTGLMERLVAEISNRGHSVSTIKHAHHNTDVDQPGRDSYRHRTAGAQQVLLASPNRWALMHELRGADEPSLEQLMTQLTPVDLVLVEGYKAEGHPKIECYRGVNERDPLAGQNDTISAFATDTKLSTTLKQFDLDDTVSIANFILNEVGL